MEGVCVCVGGGVRILDNYLCYFVVVVTSGQKMRKSKLIPSCLVCLKLDSETRNAVHYHPRHLWGDLAQLTYGSFLSAVPQLLLCIINDKY